MACPASLVSWVQRPIYLCLRSCGNLLFVVASHLGVVSTGEVWESHTQRRTEAWLSPPCGCAGVTIVWLPRRPILSLCSCWGTGTPREAEGRGQDRQVVSDRDPAPSPASRPPLLPALPTPTSGRSPGADAGKTRCRFSPALNLTLEARVCSNCLVTCERGRSGLCAAECPRVICSVSWTSQ